MNKVYTQCTHETMRILFLPAVEVLLLFFVLVPSRRCHSLEDPAVRIIQKRGQYVAAYKQIYEYYINMHFEQKDNNRARKVVKSMLEKSSKKHSFNNMWKNQAKRHALVITRLVLNEKWYNKFIQDFYVVMHVKFMALRAAVDILNEAAVKERQGDDTFNDGLHTGEFLLAFSELGIDNLYNRLSILLQSKEDSFQTITQMVAVVNRYISWYKKIFGKNFKKKLKRQNPVKQNIEVYRKGEFLMDADQQKAFYEFIKKKEAFVYQAVKEAERLFINISFVNTDRSGDADAPSFEERHCFCVTEYDQTIFDEGRQEALRLLLEIEAKKLSCKYFEFSKASMLPTQEPPPLNIPIEKFKKYFSLQTIPPMMDLKVSKKLAKNKKGRN